MSDTFDHELEAFEDAFNHGLFGIPQDIDNYPESIKDQEEGDHYEVSN